MGRFVIAAYRPKPGKERELAALVERHMDVLRAEDLVTGKPAYVMRALNGTFVEVFEWQSVEAIAKAHESVAVQALWDGFAEVCDYVPLTTLAEAQEMFAEFDSVSPA
jgi:quinol monooxygenase YgiN